jgi:hypothetical protein
MVVYLDMLVNLKFDTEKESVDDLQKLHKWVGDLLAKRGVGVEQASVVQQASPVRQVVQQNGSVPSSMELKAKQEAKKKPSRTAGGCRFVEFDNKVEDMVSSLLCKQRIR